MYYLPMVPHMSENKLRSTNHTQTTGRDRTSRFKVLLMGVPFSKHSRLECSQSHKTLRVYHFFDKLLDYNQIGTCWPEAHPSLWRYFQLCHFCHSTSRTPATSRPPTSFEKLCSKVFPQTHLISMIYNLL